MKFEQIFFDAIAEEIIWQLDNSGDPKFCMMQIASAQEYASDILEALKQKAGSNTTVKLYGQKVDSNFADLGVATEIRNKIEIKATSAHANPGDPGERFVLFVFEENFQSGNGVLINQDFNEILPKAASRIFVKYETQIRKFEEILRLIGISSWLDNHVAGTNSGVSLGFEHSDGMALILSSAAIAVSESDIGRELWRIGLVPDLGNSGLADRLPKNKSAIKNLKKVTGSIAKRLNKAGVSNGPISTRVVTFLEERNVAKPTKWCEEILSIDKSELTFENWEFGSNSAELTTLKIKPFRDASGAVKRACKLRQNSPNTYSEALYIDVGFGKDGYAVKPPSVVASWETKPDQVESVERWLIELCLPVRFRQIDTEPFLQKTIKGDRREIKFKLDLELDSIRSLDLDGTLLVVLQITALGRDNLALKFKNSILDAVAISQEFEIKILEAVEIVEPLSQLVRVDDAISRSQAKLDVCVTSGGDKQLAEELYWLDYESLVEICYKDGESLHDRRLIRTLPFLNRLQVSLISALDPGSKLHLKLTKGRRFDVSDVLVENLSLPKNLTDARREFFNGCLREADIKDKPSIEFLKWSNSLSRSLDKYAEAYISCLRESTEETRSALLALDTLTIETEDIQNPLCAVLLLPTHPLRAKWLCDYSQLLDGWATTLYGSQPEERKQLVDLNFVEMMSPANTPYFIQNWSGSSFAYIQEVIFGYGIFLDPLVSDYEGAVSEIFALLEGRRPDESERIRAGGVRRIVERYLAEKSDLTTLSLLALNSGDGGVLARVLRKFLKLATEDDEEASSEFRVELIAYADRVPFSNPLRSLKEVQSAFRDVLRIGAKRVGLALFASPFALALRKRERLVQDEENVNLAIAHGLTAGEVRAFELPYVRNSYLGGLICGTQSRQIDVTASSIWHTIPSISCPDNKILNQLQSAHHFAFLTVQAAANSIPGIAVSLSGQLQNELRALHSRADRVAISDRFVSLAWFSGEGSFGLMNKAYVLDYTPNFVEGVSDRFIVSTQYREEVIGVVSRAMEELDLFIESETRVLDYLSIVSGRLVFQLLNSQVEAREAVGLALTIHYLEVNAQLHGWVVVPVDAHLEVFGATARPEDSSFKRCDLLLVRFSERLIEIRCVEVKARQSRSNINSLLLRQIREQLEDTERVLLSRFFNHSSNRVDLLLQQAHFSSILHHYIDKGLVDRVIDPSDDEKYHQAADNFANLDIRITKEGYVVCIDEPTGRVLVDEPGLEIKVIGASDLSSTEFSTKQEAKTRTTVLTLPPTDITGDPKPPNEPSPMGGGPTPPKSPAGPEGMVTKIDGEGSDRTPTRDDVEVEIYKPVEMIDPPLKPPAIIESVIVKLGRDLSGVDVNWKVSTMGSPHALILGQTGQGKSVTTRQIVNTFSDSGLPSLILDFHGDMADNPPAEARVINIRREGLGISPFELSGHLAADVTEAAYEISEIVGFVCDLGDIQTTHVFRALVECYRATGWIDGNKGERLPTISEFASAVEQVEAGAKGRNARERLLPLTDFGLFPEGDGIFFDPSGGGHGLILDLRGLNEKVQRAAYSFVMRKVYRSMFLWDQNSQMKLAVVTDEAHRFSADKTLPKMMKEGRKYGLSCLVASQSIGDFNRDVIANSGCKIVFRTNFPDSKAVAGFVRGVGKDDLSKEIEKLAVGEAFVSTPDNHIAKRTKMFSVAFEKKNDD